MSKAEGFEPLLMCQMSFCWQIDEYRNKQLDGWIDVKSIQLVKLVKSVQLVRFVELVKLVQLINFAELVK